MELRICFEVTCEDSTFGMQVSLGETSKPIDYKQLAESVDIKKLISVACLDELGVTENDVKVITPAEYDELYRED